MSVRRNLEFLIDQARTNPNALASITGVPQPTIHRILTGESKDPRTETLRKLADFFGVTVADLRDESFAPAQQTKTGANVWRVAPGSRRVPLIAYPDAARQRQGKGMADGYILTDQELSDDAFAVELVNESMAPDFKPGDRVICDPAVRPQPGDFLIAEHAGQPVFGRYRPRQDSTFELVQLNPDYPTLTLSPDSIIATMLEHRRYRRAR
jgi:SOS-response transcriptional repressor LexA